MTVLTESEWHVLRAKHVGASEVAALFDAHPHMTRFELWHIKAGNLPRPDLDDDERVFWGTVLEPAVALGVAKRTGWNIRKVRRYLVSDTVPGMGASLDYEIVAHERGPGVLEIKTVDSLQFRTWDDGELPLHYELQLQHQLAVTGRSWGCVGVLIGGNALRLYERERRPKTIAKIEKAVAAFWQSIAEAKPPQPDFATDAEAIAALYQSVIDGKVIDLTGDNRLPELCAAYQAAAKDEKEAAARKEAAKAEILTKIGDAEIAICGDFKISAKTVSGGIVTYERKPYRSFRLSESKKGKQAA